MFTTSAEAVLIMVEATIKERAAGAPERTRRPRAKKRERVLHTGLPLDHELERAKAIAASLGPI